MHFLGRYNIDIHDYSVRLRAAKKFLKAGDKVIEIIINISITVIFILLLGG